MVDLYVYYKVSDAAAARLAPLVRAMQAGLAASEGVRPGLKRRPGGGDGLQTWMEVYPDVPAAFDAALARAVEAAGLAGLTGTRHTEVFTDLPPCA